MRSWSLIDCQIFGLQEDTEGSLHEAIWEGRAISGVFEGRKAHYNLLPSLLLAHLSLVHFSG